MARYVEGSDRQQVTLLPKCLDDYIAEDNPVRVVDAFVGELDLEALGFERMTPATTGRPAYHPAVLLKIYIYGYLNRVASSRRLERECQRNIELMWLTGRLAPDFKTIAEFRRLNGPGIRRVCGQFIVLCRRLKLFTQRIVAIDGSKFKAVNSRDKNYTPNKVDRRIEQVEESIQRYLEALETADRTQPAEIEAKTTRLRQKIAKLREQVRQFGEIKQQLVHAADGQISATAPDARSMATHGKGTGIVGYNVQAAVATKHHLIVAHEVTNEGHDRGQLANMAGQAREAMGKTKLEAIADRGYFSGPLIKECEDAGIAVCVPKPMTSTSKAAGRFSKADFVYIARDDEYQCPAGQRMRCRMTTFESGGLWMHSYWPETSTCQACSLRPNCTTGKFRSLKRWEHEHVLERVQARLDRNPDRMAVRRRTIEHVFGTLKHWMGATHFLTSGMESVSTEASLHVLAYNLKRVMSVLGIARTMKAMQLAGL
jgi:transposase